MESKTTNCINARQGLRIAKMLVLAFSLLFLFVTYANGRNIALLEKKVYMDQLNWWNAGATQRIWGCAECEMGDIACSLGAAIASAYNISCGYTGKKADYYGYLDIDDEKARLNPLFRRNDSVWDTKIDMESGRPDWSLINDSIESIQTNITAYFIKEARWRGKPHWLQIDHRSPLGGDINWQTWLMPCKNNSNTTFNCRWTKCEQMRHEICPCDNSNASLGNCYNTTCNTGGTDVICYKFWGDNVCYLDSKDVYACTGGEHGGCDTCDSFDQATDNCAGGGGRCQSDPRSPDTFCCWACDPTDLGGNALDGGWCGFGGSRIEMPAYKTGFFNYTDYPRSNQSGANLNDDVELAIPPFTAPNRRYWGTMPHVLGGVDDDFVRDRYWIRNATDTEFLGTRYGYCSNESKNDPNTCIEAIDLANPQRDQYDRPISRQHDPCRSCEKGFDFIYDVNDLAHNIDHPVCPDECFTYDLRYYRQPNVHSLFAFILGITPELDTTFVGMPFDDRLPDVSDQCISGSKGKYECQTGLPGTKEIGAPCANEDECISGMSCTGFLSTPDLNKHCCPIGTYYWANAANTESCCRFKLSHECSQLVMDCPVEKRVPADDTKWDEFDTDLAGWYPENFYGTKPDGNYMFGIAEKGCVQDEECAVLKYPLNLADDLNQHCSDANPTGSANCPQPTSTTSTTLLGESCDAQPCGRRYTFRCQEPNWGFLCGECGGTCPAGYTCAYTERDLGPCACLPAPDPCVEDTFGQCTGSCSVPPAYHGYCTMGSMGGGLDNECNGCYCYGKPAIYLYPGESSQVNVTLSVEGGGIVVSDPPYGNGWRVNVEPGGRIDGEFDYLFYEAESDLDFGQEEAGWVVRREDVGDWFRKYLPMLGLNGKETGDFTEYWVPMLNTGRYYKITQIRQEQLDRIVALEVEPEPDTVIRVNLVITPLDAPEDIPEPHIAKAERRGFTVVEWGLTFADSCDGISLL
ncbi:MAG: hypothetical protein V1875_00565 [Candidatus Altiarchaeota archaeon]